MAGYLDQYGAGEERRERIVKIAVLSVVVLVVAGGVLYFLFKNFREERQVKNFFELLARHDYQAAYALWGCTPQKPCRDYPYSEFLKDWGAPGPRADVGHFRISRSRSCGSGVILTIDFGNQQEEKLWVERGDLTIGFSPWPGCPPGR